MIRPRYIDAPWYPTDLLHQISDEFRLDNACDHNSFATEVVRDPEGVNPSGTMVRRYNIGNGYYLPDSIVGPSSRPDEE